MTKGVITMNRLIKAEWYRIRKSSKFIFYIIFICASFILMSVLSDLGISRITVSKSMQEYAAASIVFMPPFISILASIIIGMAYNNKTALYEVMCGNKIRNIILSKVIVTSNVITVTLTLFFCTYYVVIGFINGIGDLKQIPLRIFLFIVVIFHFCVIGILIMTFTRHLVGVALVWIRMAVIEGILIGLIKWVSNNTDNPEKLVNVTDWFINYQLIDIFTTKISLQLSFAVIISLVIEFVFWFGLSYISMKKKM